jgi:hypothetical protein
MPPAQWSNRAAANTVAGLLAYAAPVPVGSDSRREQQIVDIAQAERNLEVVETATLAGASRRRSIAGRVHLPRKLPSIGN